MGKGKRHRRRNSQQYENVKNSSEFGGGGGKGDRIIEKWLLGRQQ
jgi:hypothetical protein